MKRRWLFTLLFLVGIVLLVLTFQFFPMSDLTGMLINIPVSLIVAYLAVSFLIHFLLTIRWKIITRHAQLSVPLHKLFGYRFVGHAIGFITPGPKIGGEPVRGALLQRHGATFSKGLSTCVADKTMEAVSFGVMFVIGLGVSFLTVSISPGLKTTLSLVALVILCLISYGLWEMMHGRDPIMKLFNFFRLNKLSIVKKHKKEIQQFEHDLTEFYSTDRKKFWSALAVSGVAWSVSLIEFGVLLQMLGIEANFMQIFLIYTVVGLAYMIPIPLALGSLEAMQTALLVGLGLPAAAGVAIALITRGRDLFFTLIGFILLAYYGIGGNWRPEPSES